MTWNTQHGAYLRTRLLEEALQLHGLGHQLLALAAVVRDGLVLLLQQRQVRAAALHTYQTFYLRDSDRECLSLGESLFGSSLATIRHATVGCEAWAGSQRGVACGVVKAEQTGRTSGD